MNAIELLEALLRGPAAGGAPAAEPQATETPSRPTRSPETRGADVLRDILGAGGAGAPPSAQTMPSGSVFSDPMRGEEKADVRELLRQAREREAAAAAGRPYHPTPAPARPPMPTEAPRDFPRPTAPTPAVPTAAASTRDDEATILIRAMINAAKADGRLDRDEEQKILRHLGQPSREVMAFIQSEFQKPLDTREFAWSVPLGLEQKVYAMSLAVIELDQREESDYLRDLARGLRLAPDVCAELHQHFGAPIIR